MMFFGLSMVLKPLSVLTDVLPFLGDLVEMGSSLVAFLIALPCALVVIAVAWLFFRPVLYNSRYYAIYRRVDKSCRPYMETVFGSPAGKEG